MSALSQELRSGHYEFLIVYEYPPRSEKRKPNTWLSSPLHALNVQSGSKMRTNGSKMRTDGSKTRDGN